MKSMKKNIAVLLVIALVAGLFPGALAEWGWGSASSSDWGWGTTTGSSDWNTAQGYSYSVTANTNLYSASSAQLNNISLAAAKLNGITVEYNEKFSFNNTVGPRSAANGYKNAINGRGVAVRGGGVGQVATTLYLALRQLSGVQFDAFKTYGEKYTGTYVDDGDDAIVVDTNAGNDLSFRNLEGRMKIEMWVSFNYLYCTISVNSSGGDTSSLGTQVGYASLPLSGTNTLCNNIRIACDKINGTKLTYYNDFSFNHVVGPRTSNYGYGYAINGRGVKVIGGGVAQVATVVYLAVGNLSNVKITEKHTYGSRYNQTYVDNGDDAIMTDYNQDFDFSFSYRGYGTLTIVTYVNSSSSRLVCEIYEKTSW